MGLLEKCPKCNNYFMPGSPCPNCGQGNADTSAGPSEMMEEYARRREQHTLAYAAFMSRAMAGGLIGLLGAIAFGFLLFCGGLPFWFIIASIGLILFAAIVTVVAQMYLIKNRGALEVHCPACDARLDEMPMDRGCCPGCNVKLR